MSDGIRGKVVVITGASSGLGEAAARRLAALGAKLVLGARRVERIEALAKELSLPAGAAVCTDVTNMAQVRGLVDGAVKQHGRIDVILNNAGLMPHSSLERGKVEDWDRMRDRPIDPPGIDGADKANAAAARIRERGQDRLFKPG